MKTVIINGSPRKDGDTAALLSVLKEELNGDIVQYNAYDNRIRPCTDCRACWVHNRCAIDDDFSTLLEDINTADNVVIASPVYFSELTGALLGVASRLQYVWVTAEMRQQPVLLPKPRNGLILLTGGGHGSPEKALSTAQCLLKQMGAVVRGSVCSLHTDTLPAGKDTEAIEKLRILVQQL